MLTRRQLLGGAALGLLAGRLRRAEAIGQSSKFRFGQLQLGTAWNPRPNALRRLGWEIQKRTSIVVELDPAIVTPTSDTLHETPFLYFAGEKAVDLPSSAGIEALRRFLTFGGFLLVDSAEGSTDGAFDGSVRKLMQAIFPAPAKGLEIIPADHVVYKSFYLLDKPVGRLALAPATSDSSARTCRTTSAVRGHAMISAITIFRASPAARSSASSHSASASTSCSTRSASTTSRIKFTCRSS
jgi:hypothetical protein